MISLVSIICHSTLKAEPSKAVQMLEAKYLFVQCALSKLERKQEKLFWANNQSSFPFPPFSSFFEPRKDTFSFNFLILVAIFVSFCQVTFPSIFQNLSLRFPPNLKVHILILAETSAARLTRERRSVSPASHLIWFL